jgi:hypothetical protein
MTPATALRVSRNVAGIVKFADNQKFRDARSRVGAIHLQA